MGLIKRLRRINSSRIEAFLEAVEDPAVVFPELLKEMRANLRAAKNGETKALTAVKAAQRRLDEATGRSLRLERGAELALRHAGENLAREALAAQVAAEKRVEEHRQALASAQSALDQAREATLRLKSQLEDLETRKNEIIARARAVSEKHRLQQAVGGQHGNKDGILDLIARMESDVEEAEAELAIRRDMARKGSAPLDERLQALEHDAEVERRLTEIRKKRNPGAT